MASIGSKTGKGYPVRWRELRASPDGRRKARQVTCPTRRAAEHLKREIETSHSLGREWLGTAAGERVPTLAEALSGFLEDCERTRSPRSIETYRSRCNAFGKWCATRRRGALFVDLLSRETLEAFHAERLRTVSTQTANGDTGTIEKAWRWAYRRRGWAQHVAPPETIDKAPALPHRVKRAPTWAEMDTFIQHAHGHVKRAAIIARCTGLRASQVERLRWDDFDLEGGLMTIRPELGKTRGERLGRVVPVAPVLVEELATWGKREGLVLKVKHKSRGAMSNIARRIWETTGLPSELFDRQPLHSFRRGFQTGLRFAGVRGDTIRALVGHSRGITGIYVDRWSLGLEDAVALVPPIGEGVTALCAPSVRLDKAAGCVP